MESNCGWISVWKYTQYNSLAIDTIISIFCKMEMAHYGSQPFNYRDKWNEVNDMRVEKWWSEICGRGKREKLRETPIQTAIRPPRNLRGVTERRTRDPSVGRRATNRLCRGAPRPNITATNLILFLLVFRIAWLTLLAMNVKAEIHILYVNHEKIRRK